MAHGTFAGLLERTSPKRSSIMTGWRTMTPMKARSWRRMIVSLYATASTFDQKRLISRSSSRLDRAQRERDQRGAGDRQDRELLQHRMRPPRADEDRPAHRHVERRREELRDPADDALHVAHREREARELHERDAEEHRLLHRLRGRRGGRGEDQPEGERDEDVARR